MDKVNLRNMPNTVLYEYANEQYAWKILRAGGTRYGKYLTSLDDIREYTEVFRRNPNGTMRCIWSGELTANPSSYDETGLDKDGRFHIFSYDEDRETDFKQGHDELVRADDSLQLDVLKEERIVADHIEEMINR